MNPYDRRVIPWPARSGWVVEEARHDLDELLRDDASVSFRLRSWLIATGWTRLGCLIVVFVVLLAVLVGIKSLSVNVWSSLAPGSAGQTLETMWQVQAALVSLGFPFLLLLIQFSHDDGVKATRSSDVLARETFVRPALEFGVVGLSAITVVTAWLASDSALFVAAVFIEIPTLVALAWCYFKALDLLFDRPQMRRLSSKLLQERLMDSMKHLWAIRRGNTVLLDGLAQVGVHHDYAPDAGDGWWRLKAPSTGWIADINVERLVRLLGSVPLASGPLVGRDTPAQVTSYAPEAADRRIVLRRLCGDQVRQGEAVLLLKKDGFALTSEPAIPLDRALRITET